MLRLTTVSILSCVCVLALAACSPILNTRGNFLEQDRIQGFTKGTTTQEQVAQKLGSPTATDPFDKNTWFYIGEKTETTSFFNPKVTARRVVKVQFEENGVLKDIAEIDESSGKDVALVGKTTPSGGQDMNVFQQFLSNLGKFNADAMNKQQSNPGR
jgi:outer membrane protein assembly factor BamE (lipoprotein component of BamABCDE complex)